MRKWDVGLAWGASNSGNVAVFQTRTDFPNSKLDLFFSGTSTFLAESLKIMFVVSCFTKTKILYCSLKKNMFT